MTDVDDNAVNPDIDPQVNNITVEKDPLPEFGAVSDVSADQTDLQILQQQLSQQHLTIDSLSVTPIHEYTAGVNTLSLAFPTLYPNGKADFGQPRQRTVNYKAYIMHLMKWRDERFARHPR